MWIYLGNTKLYTNLENWKPLFNTLTISTLNFLLLQAQAKKKKKYIIVTVLFSAAFATLNCIKTMLLIFQDS